jgi:hypothetical protein
MADRTQTSWNEMFRRCYDRRRPKYASYGARGIKVCPEWFSYENFLADMRERPEGKTLGRLNNDGNYEKNNCAWQTNEEQADNKGSYKNNSSGIKGVSYDTVHGKWAAHTKGGNGNKKRIYFGPDFFLAVCARKSYEVNHD